MHKPYIGVTGFVTPQEAVAVLHATPPQSNRILMVGVLASTHTLRGLEDRWPPRYPNVNEIGNIFPDHPLAFNLVHFNSDSPDLLFQQLQELTSIGGPNLHGYQLNIPWPPASALEKFRAEHSQMKVVLQINNRALEMVSRSPQGLVDKLAREYAGLVDYILLDPSAGYGIPLNPRWASNYLRAIQDADLNIGLGVAGGLSPSTLGPLEPLLKEFPNLSIDAESLLRDEHDRLDVNLARDYITRAMELFGK